MLGGYWSQFTLKERGGWSILQDKYLTSNPKPRLIDKLFSSFSPSLFPAIHEVLSYLGIGNAKPCTLYTTRDCTLQAATYRIVSFYVMGLSALRSHSCTKASRSSPTSDFMASLQREIFLRLKWVYRFKIALKLKAQRTITTSTYRTSKFLCIYRNWRL